LVIQASRPGHCEHEIRDEVGAAIVEAEGEMTAA
jgi:hypothetical protein